jgi:hypothetical protein
MNRRRIALAIAIALTGPLASPISVADQATKNPSPVVQEAGGYLGVMLGRVPAILRSQLSDALPAGQGVMVQDVVEGSPAAKAGLHPYDIILAYDDQRLFSVEQLSQLVHAEGAGQSVTLKVVHGGTTIERQVVLGAARPDDSFDTPRNLPWMPGPHYYRHPLAPFSARPSQPANDNWETFDSLSLQKVEDGRFQAEIQYLDANGDLKKHQFTGSRDDIRGQILRQQDLPRAERDQLLDALSARDDIAPIAGPFGHQPGPPPWLNWQSGY